MGQFHGAVGGVDAHKHGAYSRRRHLHQQPFNIVGRPDADAIPFAEAHTQQSAGELIDIFGQFGIGQAPPLVKGHHSLMIGKTLHNTCEMLRDRQAGKGNSPSAVKIAFSHHQGTQLLF